MQESVNGPLNLCPRLFDDLTIDIFMILYVYTLHIDKIPLLHTNTIREEEIAQKKDKERQAVGYPA